MAIVRATDSKDVEQRNQSTSFFQKELVQDYRVATLERSSTEKGQPKYYISFMDGISMGGGIGLSIHAPFRVVTEKTLFAMPETAIGYFPDVGLTYVFARMDGNTGMYLGLTGSRLNGADTYLAGIATHFIRSNLLEELVQRLGALSLDAVNSADVINSILEEYASDPFAEDAENGKELAQNSVFFGDRRIALDFCFGRDSVEQIVASLKDVAEVHNDSYTLKELAKRGLTSISPEVQAFAQSTLHDLHMRSPRAVKLTFLAIKRASNMTLTETMHECMRMGTVFCDLSVGRDFHTGVMHTLTKDPKTGKRRTDRAPWSPATFEEVDDEQLETLFFGNLDKARQAGFKLPIPKIPIPGPQNNREYRKKRDAELRGVGPLHWNPAFNRYALPSEAECASLVEGSHPSAGSYVLEPQELIDVMLRHKQGKPTVERKMRDWIARRAAAETK